MGPPKSQTKPVPILLVAQELTQGGSERQLTEITKALDRSRFAPRVAVFRAGGMRFEELRSYGVRLEVFPFSSFWSPGMLRAAGQMRRYLRTEKIQLVHSFDLPGTIFATPVARAAGVPVVLSSQRTHRQLASRAAHALLRITDRLVDGTVTNCQVMARHMIEDEHVDPRKVQVCYNGLDGARFHPAPRIRKAELTHASVVAGVVCALRPEKDLLTLLEAFSRVRGQHPGFHLVFIGDGPVRAQLEQRRRELGLQREITLISSTAEVDSWLRSIDIFVLPSKSEALSNALMEAMGCGCAVVASRVGGNVELIEHGERGLLFAAGDAGDLETQLRHLMDYPADRQRLAAAGCSFIHQSFTLEAAAQRMGEIYGQHLARAGGWPPGPA